MTNPLLDPPHRPHGTLPFDLIRAEHFVPALDHRIAAARQQLDGLRTDSASPCFANTFATLERIMAPVHDLAYVYGSLRLANGDAAMQALAKEIMPRLIQLESDVNLDPLVFGRVRAAFEGLASENPTPEQKTLAERMYRGFCRNGALLDDEGKRRLRAIDEELATLGPQYSENVLKATQAYELTITDPADLAGLPESVCEAAAQAAKERGQDGAWVFTLQAPSVQPFLRYASSRELRHQIWQAYSSRALDGAFDNRRLVLRIARLRHERARLLGYETHASYQLEERMAESPDRVRAFLERLHSRSVEAARAELAELQELMRSESGAAGELMPWDYAYWADKLKERRYALNAEELRPYFPLEQVLNGAFEHAQRLYDLQFKLLSNVATYAEDVQVYEVSRQGVYKGLLYTDFYPRATKAGGAWCSRFKSQWHDEDGDHRPHVTIVCNFSKPVGDAPSLLTLNETRTLFHEFGHALHSLLSNCQHRSLSCTNVYRDFVELPSQIMENWLKEKESLALFARHYKTGAPLPDEWVDKIIASDNFHAAYMMMRQLRFAMLDLAWHGGDPSGIEDVVAYENAALETTRLFPDVPGTNTSVAFEHIFSGGYSAGYYGYKWAEVLDADAFALFKEKGIFSREVADRFRKAILERGGSEHPMRLYKEFRGREPDPDALLRRAGLLSG